MVTLGLVAILAIALARTFTATSRQITAPPAPALVVRAGALDRLAAAIRVATVAHDDRAQDDVAAFAELRVLLEAGFPRVHAVAPPELIADRSLLYTWRGSDPMLPPVLLIAHYDVVPADPSGWTHPPFSGARADGFIWGRGALDDKNGVLGLLEAAEALLEAGFTPRRSVLFGFGGDEEAGGAGARAIAATLKARGIRPLLVLDEGGPIAEGIVPGLARPVALIGVAEKGYLTLELVAEDLGGHSSMPPEVSAAGRIGRAVSRLEADQFPMRVDGAAAHFMDWVGPEMGFTERLAFRNRWLLEPLIKSIYDKKKATRATLRTTTAVTMLSGSAKENVLPREARAVVNFRVLPGDTHDSVEARVRRVIDDPEVEIRRRPGGSAPSPVSDPEGPGFALLQRTIAEVIPDVLVAPYLTLGITDARAYTALSDHVFRFSAIRYRPEDLARFHGVDERVREADYLEAIRFYARLIQNADALGGPSK